MLSFRKNLLYAGLERKEFEALMPDARRENRKKLRVYSMVMAFSFFVMFLVQLPRQGALSSNAPVYLGASLACGAIFACTKKLLPAHPRLDMALVRIFMGILYLFSFSLIFLHTDLPSVTAIVVLLVVPFLFADRPAVTVSVDLAAIVIFCLLCYWKKPPALASLDLWNAVTFGLLGMIASVFQSKGVFHSLHQTREIKYLSETDLLTGAKNRNSYENKMNGYPGKCARNVGCVYADVNGLHELNNRSGHKAGDAMLTAVAEALIARFGPENTYRVGGDEFIAFRTDTSAEALEQDAVQMAQALSTLGYNTSIGAACREKDGLEMLALIHDAEMAMYQKKRVYYQHFGHDRRRR